MPCRHVTNKVVAPTIIAKHDGVLTALRQIIEDRNAPVSYEPEAHDVGDCSQYDQRQAPCPVGSPAPGVELNKKVKTSWTILMELPRVNIRRTERPLGRDDRDSFKRAWLAALTRVLISGP